MEVEEQPIEVPKDEKKPDDSKPEPKTPKDQKEPKTPKEQKEPRTPKEQKEPKTPKEAKTPKDQKETKPVNKIDAYIKFKAPGEKSPKKQKIEPQQKTPVKIDVLEEVAMPSWSDNSSSEIIKPKETRKDSKDSEIMIIDDSEDIKLVYEETQNTKSGTQSPDPSNTDAVKDPSKSTDKPSAEQPKSPTSEQNAEKNKPSSPKIAQSTLESSNFLKQAKVTDVKEPVAVKAAPSPKAPRRVSFVTLSSPKNAKKK